MTSADWWERRRFGIMIDVSLASVPAWAPVGQEASWYRAHVDANTHDVNLQTSPLAESLHHHARRWPHIERYDDFFPFLHFDAFDPDEWAALARDAGMRYAVMTAKHHDGLCWWDAPGTDRTVLHDGPARNVFGQFAAACERADLPLGASYSLLDWADERYPSSRYVDEVVHPQVLDLVTRYGIASLRGEAQWGAGGGHWRSDELHAAVRSHRPDIVIDDRWWAETADIVTIEHRMPESIVDRAWEFRRPFCASAAHNRAEPNHLLSPANEIVSLLTEVIAKNGHLLLQVGADAAGQIPESVVERLRAIGGWVRRHQDLVDTGRPWSAWGDEQSRMIMVGDELHAIDASGAGRFGALRTAAGRVVSIRTHDDQPVDFTQDDTGVQIRRPPRRSQRMPAVYRIELEPPPPPPVSLFDQNVDREGTHRVEPIALADLVVGATRGDIVQLGDATYVGPARVPDGVTVRGLGPHRTTIDGMESVAVTVGAAARIEHCRITGSERRIGRLPLVRVRLGGAAAAVVGCTVDGHVEVAADKGRVVSCTAAGVVARSADEVEVLRSTFRGIGTDVGVEIAGGSNHQIDGCNLRGHLSAIELVGTVGAAVRHNQIQGRWWGVRLRDTDATEVTANAIERTMRAVDVDGGAATYVQGNAVVDGDSGCVVQDGAANVQVTGNHWERCRIGLLSWGAVAVHDRDNMSVDLGEPDGERVSGPS